MAYLKIRRFQEAEDDCTEALNLDDRYIKAYSRRSTARTELKKFKESMEDADFALKLEPNNQEVKKQYLEAKSMYEKDLLQRTAGALHRTAQGVEKKQETGVRLQELSSPTINTRTVTPVSSLKDDLIKNRKPSKLEQKPSVQELAARAASQAINEAAQNITPPSSAYQFEVIWRGFSGDCALQARLLKATSPNVLPQLFKNALTATMLMDIIKCLATIFNEEMELTVQYLENLTKVSRFDMVILCLSSADRTDMAHIWNNVFGNKAIPMEHAERLDDLRPKYCR
uniref:RNA-polymerase II-associated protein 3-like C-terminal domain-containing protein n=1 Tax=Kalanchoe fedtschenkoi TaxID=63787 RepID=A0A7N0U7V1_KALFE